MGEFKGNRTGRKKNQGRLSLEKATTSFPSPNAGMVSKKEGKVKKQSAADESKLKGSHQEKWKNSNGKRRNNTEKRSSEEGISETIIHRTSL